MGSRMAKKLVKRRGDSFYIGGKNLREHRNLIKPSGNPPVYAFLTRARARGYELAGYKCREKTAEANASRLLSNVKVSA